MLPKDGVDNVQTGWDNHRWVRYRALLSVLPGWLEAVPTRPRCLAGANNPATPPSYTLTPSEAAVADQLATDLETLATTASAQSPAAVAGLDRGAKPARSAAPGTPDLRTARQPAGRRFGGATGTGARPLNVGFRAVNRWPVVVSGESRSV